MENINLSTIGDRHITTVLLAIPMPLAIIGNLQTTLHRHRQPPVSVIGINQSPSLDLAISYYFANGINTHRQLL